MLTQAKLPKDQGRHNAACLWVATLLVLFPAESPVPKQGLMLCKFLSSEQVTKKEPTSGTVIWRFLLHTAEPNSAKSP